MGKKKTKKAKQLKKHTELSALVLLKYFVKSINSLAFTADRRKKIMVPAKKLRDLFQAADKEFNEADADAKAEAKASHETEHKKANGKVIKKRRVELADILDWNEVHEHGQILWKELMSAAIIDIEKGAKGHSALLKYLEAATEFEDLLYGLEEFYRDHTLHSLWVYLIGVKLMGEGGDLEKIADRLNWYVYNDVQEDEYPPEILDWATLEQKYLNSEITKRRDAMWCVMALCHDLGYSLAKLHNLNEKVQAVLKFYDVANIQNVGYTLDIEHQYLMNQFLELMAMEIRITPGNDCQDIKGLGKRYLKDCIKDAQGKWKEDEFKREKKEKEARASGKHLIKDEKEKHNYLYKLLKDAVAEKKLTKPTRKKLKDLAREVNDNVLTKCFRDDAAYWRLCKALERKEHGILSAYLLYKTMGLFANTSVRSTAEEWGLEDEEAIDNIIRGDILFAIAQHEFAFAHVDQMSSLAEILILCDELEEFSRLGRQLQSRKYQDTTATTSVSISYYPECAKPNPKTTEIEINMTYNSQHVDLGEFSGFCCRKAKTLCQLFSLDSKKRHDETFRIREIETIFHFIGKAPNVDSEHYFRVIFIMNRNGDVKVAVFRSEEIDHPNQVKLDVFASKEMKPINEVTLECRDDEIYVKDEDNSFEKWVFEEYNIPE